MFETIDHVGIAVEDLEAALALYTRGLGMEVSHRETIEEQGVEAVLLQCGPSHVELLAALGPETAVGKFLERRGPGLHHVAYRVGDINGELARLRDAGFQLIDTSPRHGIAGTRVAFVHPKSVGGVLTELVEPPGHDGEGTTRRKALGGRRPPRIAASPLRPAQDSPEGQDL